MFGDKVWHAAFNFADHATHEQVKGSDGVFVLGPPLNMNLDKLLAPFLDYLDLNGPKRVVYLSANGMEALEELPFHLHMEQKLKTSSLDWRIVRPGFFMQNFGNYERENIEQRKVLFTPAGNGRTAFISTKDIGEAVAELLTNNKFTRQTFTLTGSELFSYFDVADLLTRLRGEKISYANPDEQTYRQVLRESGAPDFIGDYMLPVYGLIKNGKVENISNDVEKLTAHPPERLENVLKRDFT